jgi:quercetin dioxygenase-like cupin family protein
VPFANRLAAPPSPVLPPLFRSLPLHALRDMAKGLAQSSNLFADRPPGTDARGGVRLLATEDYDAWLIEWPPGTEVTPHDHGDSAGAFCVVQGELQEVRWHRSVRRFRFLGPGDVALVERGVVHNVIAGEQFARSVHVYSPPLTSMSWFDDAGLVRIGSSAVEAEPVVASARGLHPAGAAAL